ncbi:carboxypeptidase-like regulatory domain-containing protein [Zhouia sp. PK063]|uniref:carboxypeptidase-like regulatory domain-containing protein n=1 Tax=Zhouia sp. PK063 TaxID=3373602 RepID=UPI00378E923F
MRKLLRVIVILLTFKGYSQLNGTVINSQTKAKIPFVNISVANKNIGTNTNASGEFTLSIKDNETLIFSALGYQTKTVLVSAINNKIIALDPAVIALHEVDVMPRRETKLLQVGSFEERSIKSYFECNEFPWLSGQYFKYSNNYYDTPFLSEIKLVTKSRVKDAKFNLRLYTINEQGKPEDFLYNSNIIAVAKKGKHITTVNISNLNIKFPENGLYVAIEWFAIPSNKYSNHYKILKEKYEAINYEPLIGVIPTDNLEEKCQTYTTNLKDEGQFNAIIDFGNTIKKQYHKLAMQLILTN